jgi:hypothetical protein
MKLGLLFSLLLVGCGAAPEPTQEHSSTTVDETYNYDSPGTSGGRPCDKVNVIVFVVDGQKIVREVPALCNPNGDPYHGDPDPDRTYAVDPDPWDKSGVQRRDVHISEREAQGNAVR